MLAVLYITEYELFSTFFFFNDTATTEIYTLSLHDALPISTLNAVEVPWLIPKNHWKYAQNAGSRSEEHTSELQSRLHLVCRLLLEKKKKSTCRSLSTPYPLAKLRGHMSTLADHIPGFLSCC